jgi:nucleoside-diphosphate-sugar epimerase
VDIFHKAAKNKDYTCYIAPDTRLPMMYMPDAIKATIGIMEAPADLVKVRTSYNVGSFSFTPEDLAAAIRKEKPNFKIDYAIDSRNDIALGWPQSINDSVAREDWNWKPDFSLEAMVKDMLKNLA